ncbi:hypothetical protein GFS24_17700 [Chitinophaga sp. SYP-B3965]|uniref:hypothetical protein n=1 Tax=Chitinophaga sp. SYP-B3965 TaxID=2663120 RepID=UPI00129961BE|nr:hypothetical protein [Chitinophaga sp. SYP-B3965]MRG46961.1 hypothetical protein [Chitinophaga sp. SYP-B3965]
MASKNTNYIQHLNAFIKTSQKDKRLKGNHISLYLALFSAWNDSFFSKSFKLNRTKLLSISHIGSCHTYRNCMADLEIFGYLRYHQSITRGVASSVTLIPIWEIDMYRNAPATVANMPTDDSRTAPAGDANMLPDINNTNSVNRERGNAPPPNKKNSKEQGPIARPENLDDVVAFFHLLGQPETEAAKFFHHYEANDWRQAGKVPITNWPAAARKWILNIHPTPKLKNDKRAKPGNLHTNQNKGYSNPL